MLADGERVFGMSQGVDALAEPERLAEHGRLEPAIPLTRGGVTPGSAAEDVEANRFLPCVHQPVFADAGLPVRLAQENGVFVDGAGTDDFQNHVGGSLQLDMACLPSLD